MRYASAGSPHAGQLVPPGMSGFPPGGMGSPQECAPNKNLWRSRMHVQDVHVQDCNRKSTRSRLQSKECTLKIASDQMQLQDCKWTNASSSMHQPNAIMNAIANAIWMHFRMHFECNLHAMTEALLNAIRMQLWMLRMQLWMQFACNAEWTLSTIGMQLWIHVEWVLHNVFKQFLEYVVYRADRDR